MTLYKLDIAGERVPLTPAEIAQFETDGGLPQGPTIVAKGDVWRRATDGEAAVIDASLQSQPLRLRNLFRDAAYLSSNDELWPDLYAGFVVAFGPQRAAELLAPSA